MPAITLGQVSRGIDRTKTRGNAQPDGLHDLQNAYVTPARTIRKRPGFRRVAFVPSGSGQSAVGMASFSGELFHFWHVVPGGWTYIDRLKVLRHPSGLSEWTLVKTNVVGVFLGRLYVIGTFTFSDFGATDVVHFWLQEPPERQRSTEYDAGDVVRPLGIDNGFQYALRELPTFPKWSPNVARTVGQSVVPTETNGYRYEAIQTTGEGISGDAEPEWPTTTKPGSNTVLEVRSPTASVPAQPAPEPVIPEPDPVGPGRHIRDEYVLIRRDPWRPPTHTL